MHSHTLGKVIVPCAFYLPSLYILPKNQLSNNQKLYKQVNLVNLYPLPKWLWSVLSLSFIKFCSIVA